MLSEVQQHLVFLMVDPFGNYLFQKLVEHTEPSQWQVGECVVRAWVRGSVVQCFLSFTHSLTGSAVQGRAALCAIHSP